MGCRKNILALTAAERTAFVNAVLALKNSTPSMMGMSGRYDDYVMIHMNTMPPITVPGAAHQGPAFCPWHRYFLYQLELELQAIDPSVTIPYWDWTNSSTATVGNLPWTTDFMGGNGEAGDLKVTTGPFAYDAGQWTIHVKTAAVQDYLRRQMGAGGGGVLPTSSAVSTVLGVTPYDAAPWDGAATTQPSFRNALEGWYTPAGSSGAMHNQVHNWVGGDMRIVMTSPNDPVFWLHHANIDRIWAMWQRQQGLPYSNFYIPVAGGPLGHNLNDPMSPWGGTVTPASVLDHCALGYYYDTEVSAQLNTFSIAFTDIPAGVGGTGVTTYRPINFQIDSPCTSVRLEVTAGPTAGFAAPNAPKLVPATPLSPPTTAMLWIAYTSTNPGDSIPNGSVTVRAVDATSGTVLAGPTVVNLVANTVPRPTSAVALVLDRSGSMATIVDTSSGARRVDLLRQAVATFVDVMQQGDGLGIVRFDNLVDTLMNVQDVGANPGGAGRTQALYIAAPTTTEASDPAMTLDPRGSTSIGGGIVAGKTALNAAAGSYTVKAMIVLTDGLENTDPLLSDPSVAASLTANTFAIGFGEAASISTAALNTITQGHGGYLVITGPINSTSDSLFLLTEYFLKIQAGVTNNAAVLDPRGELIYGVTHRIPFMLTSADIAVDVILLSPAPYYIDFALETPDGKLIDPAVAGVEPAVQFISTPRVSYYRASLPMLHGDIVGSHAGQWHALLKLGKRAGSVDAEFIRQLKNPVLPYSLLVHAASNLSFKPSVTQTSFEPGAAVVVRAVLNQYDVPLEKRAAVWAEITRPDGSGASLVLPETEAGRFEAGFTASLIGVYTVRVRAQGTTFEGQAFNREQKFTATVFPGGDQKPPTHSQDDRLCNLLMCLLSNERIERELTAKGFNVKVLEECVKMYCAETRGDLGGEHEYVPSAVHNGPGYNIAQLIAQPDIRQALLTLERELTASQGTVNFAHVRLGEPIPPPTSMPMDMGDMSMEPHRTHGKEDAGSKDKDASGHEHGSQGRSGQHHPKDH